MSKTFQESLVCDKSTENDFQDNKDITSFDKSNRRHEARTSKTVQRRTICGDIQENDFCDIRERTAHDIHSRRQEGHDKEKIPLLQTSNSQQHEKQCDTVNSSAGDKQTIPNQPSLTRRKTADKPNDRPHNSMTSIVIVEPGTPTKSNTIIDLDNELDAAEIKRKQKPCACGCLRSTCFVVALVFMVCISIPLYVIYFQAKFDNSGGVHGDCFKNPQIKSAEFIPHKDLMTASATNITWRQPDPDIRFVQLDDTGQLIIIMAKGTYSVFVLLAVDSINCKTNDTKSLICLGHGKKNPQCQECEKCAMAKLAKDTVASVPIRLDIFLENGDLLWVTGLGFDCADTSKSYMTIIKF